MFFVHAEARPASPETRAVYRGAFVNCFANAESADAALELIAAFLREAGWELAEIAELRPTARDEWTGISGEQFDQAVSDVVVAELHAYRFEAVP